MGEHDDGGVGHEDLRLVPAEIQGLVLAQQRGFVGGEDRLSPEADTGKRGGGNNEGSAGGAFVPTRLFSIRESRMEDTDGVRGGSGSLVPGLEHATAGSVEGGDAVDSQKLEGRKNMADYTELNPPYRSALRCLFSGRFDRPHCGHIRQIQELGKRFAHVCVVILDHEEQVYPVRYRQQILRDILAGCVGSYSVHINRTHFSQITKQAADEFGCEIYAAGNMEVLKHMERIGYDTLWLDRAYDYEATNDRLGSKIRSEI